MVNVLIASVQVYVGSEACDDVSSRDIEITCQPPKTVPQGSDNGKAPVTVSIVICLYIQGLIAIVHAQKIPLVLNS